MDRLGCPYDPGAEGFGDHLVAQANAEYRNSFVELANDVERAAGLAGRAGAGREDDRLWCEFTNLCDVDLCIAHHQRLPPESLEIAGEIVDEAVVVVYEEEHDGLCRVCDAKKQSPAACR